LTEQHKIDANQQSSDSAALSTDNANPLIGSGYQVHTQPSSLNQWLTGNINGQRSQPTYAVVDPWTMMVKLGHAAIADRAVFGADRFVNDASVAELGEIQRVTFWQIQNHLHPLTHNTYFRTRRQKSDTLGILDQFIKVANDARK